jgi:hypothetical protein
MSASCSAAGASENLTSGGKNVKKECARKVLRVCLKKVAQLSELVILSRFQAAKNLPWQFPQRDSSLRSE